MRALVALLVLGVATLVACNKDSGGGAGTPGALGGYAGTPQPCSISQYTGGMCTQAQGFSIVMPGSWPLSTGWSFPNPWNAQAYQCGCPRVNVAYPGQPAFQQEQIGVFFAGSTTVACAPVGYFRDQTHMYVGNVNALLQTTAMMGINPGSQSGMGAPSPYMTSFRGGFSGYGAYAAMGPSNYYGVNNPQMNSPYGTQQMGISDPFARQCLDRMVLGCDLALEERLRMYGQSQCGGMGQCVPAVQPTGPGQTPTTLGKCSYANAFAM